MRSATGAGPSYGLPGQATQHHHLNCGKYLRISAGADSIGLLQSQDVLLRVGKDWERLFVEGSIGIHLAGFVIHFFLAGPVLAIAMGI
jgi:hypothetical protein